MKTLIHRLAHAAGMTVFFISMVCMPIFSTNLHAEEVVVPESTSGVNVEVVGAQEAGKFGGGALLSGLTAGQIIVGAAILGGITAAVVSAAGDDDSSSTSFH